MMPGMVEADVATAIVARRKMSCNAMWLWYIWLCVLAHHFIPKEEDHPMKLNPNIGDTDRIIRIVAGLLLLVIGIFVKMALALSIILVLLGAVLIVTAVLRFCPLYLPLKMNTLKK
jgi:hypothetical protein